MTTLTLQIGNSDDKLPQRRWAEFYSRMDAMLQQAGQVHFAAGSPAVAPWQNACWVLLVEDTALPALREAVVALRAEFDQESVAWTEGATAFV